MTDDRQAHVRGILEHPDDDTRRLVYADWLDEQGRPADAARAELIRTQVELAKGCPDARPDVPKTNYCQRCRELKVHRAQADALLKRWGARWLPQPGRGAAAVEFGVNGSVLTAGIVNPGDYTFDRGFVSQVKVTFGWRSAEERPPLHAGACGAFLKAVLSACPAKRVTFVVQHHAPEVMVSVYLNPAGRWAATAWAVDPEDGLDEDGHLANTAAFDRRRDLLAWLGGRTGFLAHVFPQVRFTPRPQPLIF